jgi:hydrogenase maturation protease
MKTKHNLLKPAHCNNIAIVGIGNPIRSDDGLGAYICEQIDEINLPCVTVIIKHQLDIGLTEELSKFNKVIFIDASIKAETISLQPLNLRKKYPQPQSHSVHPAVLAGLAKKLYAAKTKFYICTVGGYSFEIGNKLSEVSMNYAHEAVSLLAEWIKSNACPS